MRFCYSSHMMLRLMVMVLLLGSLLFAGCVGRGVPPKDVVPVQRAALPLSPIPGQVYSETGVAAWYGKELHNKKTASGEVFDREGISAAHRTLPLGTMVRVTNLDNSKSIKVRIIDRGPFITSRILDVSYGAARELDFVSQGTTRVFIETLDEVEAKDAAQYTVQAALYTEEENAKALKRRLSKKFEAVLIVPFETNIARYFSVRVGAYASVARAEEITTKLVLDGLEPIVLRKD
jgi:rare lipoprotein A